MKNQNKTKIGEGSVVKENFGELEKITREGRSRRMMKEVVVCVQTVVGKKKFLVQFEDGKKKEINAYLLVFLILEEEVDRDEPLYHSLEK